MKEFIRTGRLGTVDLGISRDMVLQRLGNPDDCSVKLLQKSRKPSIYKYGGVELYFSEHNDTVEMIFIDDFNRETPSIDCWIVDDSLSIKEAEKELNRQGISYRKERSRRLEDSVYLISESGVYMQFAEDEYKTTRLVAVYRSRRDTSV